jgi:thiol-disulfide isomerase/thioredoxin
MIRFIPTAIVAFTISIGLSQVEFQSLSFSEAVELAQNENKLVFVDVYAEWCGPCKMLDKNVFPNETLGKKMNASFVSIKVDGDLEENWGVRESFGVTAYPTMLMIDPSSGKNRKIEGYIDAESLLLEVGYAVDPATSPAAVAMESYKSNPSRDKMREWLETMSQDNGITTEELYEVMALFVEKYPILDFEDEIEMMIFLTTTDDIADQNMQRFIGEMDNYDPQIIQYAFMQLVRAYFNKAKEVDNFSIVEDLIKEAHPLFAEHIDEQLNEANLLELVKEAFEE